MEKNPTLHARFLRLYPKNVKSGMPRRFFSHLMFTMMPIWSWLSTRPLHAVCESVKSLVWHGAVSIFLRKASQPERHPSWLKKSSSVSTRRPWSLLSKKTSSSSTCRARSATRTCSFWKSPRPNRAFAGFLFRRPLPTSLRHRSASRSAPRMLSGGSTPTTTGSSPMVWVIRWNGRVSLHFWTRGKVPDSQETAVSGINLSLLKKISENPDLLKILSAIVGSLW